MRDPAQGCLRSALAVSLLLHIGLLCSPVSLLPLRFNTDRAALQVVVAPLGRGPSKEPPRAEYSASTKQPEASRVASPADSGRAQAKSRRSLLPGSGEHIAAGLPAPVDQRRGEASPAPLPNGDGVNALGLSPQGLRDYRVALAIAARRFKHYPASARASASEGTTEVAVIVSQWRPAAEVVLVRSSGDPALDEEALSMLQQAAGTTDLPETLRGRSFRVVLPVVFSLAE